MKGIILYKSKYGAMEKYAKWLAEETGFSCTKTDKAKITDVMQYDIILLGGGIYASGIAGLSFLKKHIDTLKDKNIIVFFGGASPYDETAFNEVVAHNMKDKLSNVPCFYCRGAWDIDAMNMVDRNLCKLLLKAVTKKDPSEYAVWEKALAEAGTQKCDWTDKKYIYPIIEAIKNTDN